MELNWTTFVLEILNFLVLVWLLQRLFYRPVTEMIEKRRKGIEEQLRNSERLQENAQSLRDQYENRLQDWEKEREMAREQLAIEIEQERQKLFAQLQAELAAERKKSEVLAERKVRELKAQCEAKALKLGARFVGDLLQAMGSVELEERLVDHFITEIAELSPEQMNGLATMAENGRHTVQIVSAYPLRDERRQALQACLDRFLPTPLPIQFTEDKDLIAGLHIAVGPWIIHANLRDELHAFATFAHMH